MCVIFMVIVDSYLIYPSLQGLLTVVTSIPMMSNDHITRTIDTETIA